MKTEFWSKKLYRPDQYEETPRGVSLDGGWEYYLFYNGADADSAMIFPRSPEEFSVTIYYANPRSTDGGHRFNSMQEAKKFAERILFRLN
jgi:hypothetical protein